jgi:hypothetical protein
MAQPNTTLLDCNLYLTQYLYDPRILPSSAYECIHGNVYLRSNQGNSEIEGLLVKKRTSQRKL